MEEKGKGNEQDVPAHEVRNKNMGAPKKKKKSLHFLFSGIVMWVSPMRTRNVVPTTYVGQQHAFVVLLQNYLLG